MQTKSGGRIAFLTLDDRSSRIELVVFSQLYESCRALLVKDQLLIVEGEVGIDEFTENNKLTGRQVYDLTQAREKFAKGVSLTLHKKQLEPSFIQILQEALRPFCGGQCPLFIHYQQEHAQACLALGNEWRVKPSESLLDALTDFCGPENVRVEYGV
jgi:DNA polymerase-3 subunit alpha